MPAITALPGGGVTLTAIVIAAPGDGIALTVGNFDGVNAHDFLLSKAIVVKLA